MQFPDQPAVHDQHTFDHEQGIALQEKDIVRLLLEYGMREIDEGVSVAEVILSDLEDIEFEHDTYNKILSEFSVGFKNNRLPEQQHFLNHTDKDISSLAISILHSPYEISENWEEMHDITITDKKFIYKKDIKSSICRFKLKKLMKLIEDCQDEAKEAIDYEEATRLLKKQRHYEKVKQQLAAEMGTVVIK